MSYQKISVRFAAIFLFVLLLTARTIHASQFYNDWATNHFSDLPAQSGWTNDPDSDGEINLTEFAFGTDPRVADSVYGSVIPRFGSISGTNGTFTVEILERAGHQPGIQIDLYLSANLTNWFRPWWLRAVTNSLPGDPVGSVRESFTTRLAGTNIWFVRPKVTLLTTGPELAKYYVATNGSDSNPGTISQPFKTLTNATIRAVAGDLIYVRGGTYFTNIVTQIQRSGHPTNFIRLCAYPGEHPILDFSSQAFGSTRRGIELSNNWWYVYGLEIVGAGDNGIAISGTSNIVELCVTHNCRDTGIQIGTVGGRTPSSNLVLNCDSYRNYDIGGGAHGENADGFAAKLAGLGPNNVFRGCRGWEDADDGWDLFAAPNVVIIDTCWTFRNGSNVVNDPLYTGDGNGFKLGGIDSDNLVIPAAHHVVNCISFGNTHHGIDQNNNAAGQIVDNNTVWGNGTISGNNINLNHGSVTQGVHIVRNNLSVNGTTSFVGGSILVSNSWQLLISPAPSTNEWLSADTSWAVAPRRDDGGLPETPFMRPISGNRMIDRGTNIGNAFFGSAPDLGAFETPAW